LRRRHPRERLRRVDHLRAGDAGAGQPGGQRRPLHVQPRRGAPPRARPGAGLARAGGAAMTPAAPLEAYRAVIGDNAIDELHALARPRRGKRVQHINATRVGGGVAEILHRMVPLMNELGLAATWDVIEGNDEFFRVTKSFHNAIQGEPIELSARDYEVFLEW